MLTYKQFIKKVSACNTLEEYEKLDNEYSLSVNQFVNEKRNMIIKALELNLKIDLKGFTIEQLNDLKNIETAYIYNAYILESFGWFNF